MNRIMKFCTRSSWRLFIGTALLLVNADNLQASQQPGMPPPGPPPAAQGEPPTAPLSPQQLQQLVAPIALYPDNLVAQIMAASQFPTQVVEAERFLQQHPKWKDKKLADEVDKQDWDPSVKGLTAFPDVLSDMDKNLSWTSELGDANYNQAQDISNAIQYMRHQAQSAGHLAPSPQLNVTDNGPDIDIEPANPQVVYVPEYDPEDIYGYPVGMWPGFDPWWGMGGPYMSFGLGIGMGPFFGFGWGWGGWGMDWMHGGMMYHGGRYMPEGHAFYDRNAFMHGNYGGVGNFNRGDRGLRGFGGARAGGSGARGGRTGGGSSGRGSFGGARGGAFGGARSGGESRGFSSRGMSSMGGGFHGGGGMHGGGGRR
jgi:hypothetical protein